ncbi:class I SAM-dependent methyltransferase [Phyllobacterium chamaecytisi]|uniref:class I SAM-dependent methyltransferase n=1 Tax=Phyllobacterium chamaecytisi TaxID=2876082 RepID=UPI001CCD5104|nr:class I SAM-dependent methyltransferase [Phyllobacterium sp. KW56]MBZ9605898.1 class I SAM-dependent methyltransferase [Phyllobacterium sp. KW56]
MKTDHDLVESASSNSTDDAQAMFNKHLATYRKIVGENLMFHREVYGLLHDLLSQKMLKPFKFLDIACGDAVASAAVLKGSAIDHYYGIDLSPQSLELARDSLEALLCPVDLRCCDFVEAMADWSDVVDIVWIGMSLHHLPPEGKVRLMKNVHDALSPSGQFLIWEPTLLEGENRPEWLDRFSAYRTVWAAITDEEFATMEAHMSLADFPELAETWKAMGHQAGFSHAEQIFLMPNRFGRVFQYWS